MQQPLPVPDESNGDGDPLSDAPGRRPSPEQLAEQSALEVFPGAAELGSDEWWQPAESTDSDEAPAEPLALPPQPAEPSVEPDAPLPFAVAHGWVDPPTDEEPAADASAPAPPAPRSWGAAPNGPERVATPQTDAAPAEAAAPPVVATSEGAPAPMAATTAPAALDGATPEIPSGALSLPLLSGRERREAAGASQREAIMAQAGVVASEPGPGASERPSRRASARGDRSGAPQAAPAKRREFLTRKIRLSLIIIVLTMVSFWGGAIAAGQGSDVERGASALAPNVIERWIADRVASFSGDSPASNGGSLGAGFAPGAGAGQALVGVIAHTGGAGVPVRSTCVVEARTPRTINEGASVTVIARGVGDCSGWDVVRAGATVSWVESAYIEPAGS